MAARIVTDNGCDLLPQAARELGIGVGLLNIRFGTAVYCDSIALRVEGFYRRLGYKKTVSVTSLPSLLTFAEVYGGLVERP